MHKKLYNGFTLIQLMILLLTFSIILAASTPMITRAHKRILDRIPHGKFFCYYENVTNPDGTVTQDVLTQVNCDSRRCTKLRPDGENPACTFTPPEGAITYNIQLVGGGGGGRYYYNIGDKKDEKYETLTVGTSEFSKIPSTILPDDILKKALQGERVVYYSSTGQGKNGNNLSYYGFDISSTKCYYCPNNVNCNTTDEYTNITNLSIPGVANSFQQYFEEESIGYALEGTATKAICQKRGNQHDKEGGNNCLARDFKTTAVEYTMNYCCPQFIKEAIEAGEITDITYDENGNINDRQYNINYVSKYNPTVIYGLQANQERYVKYEETLDLTDLSGDNLRTYLDAFKNVKSGYCTASSCSDENFVESSLSNASLTESRTISMGDIRQEKAFGTGNWAQVFYRAPDGSDQIGYAAIKKLDGTYEQAGDVAKGGKGAVFLVDHPASILQQNRLFGSTRYKDYKELVNDSGEIDNTIPRSEVESLGGIKPKLKVEYAMPTRYYHRGKGGSAGNFKELTVTSISDDCDFTIGKGGAAGAERDPLYYSNLSAVGGGEAGTETKLVCSEADISLSVNGGLGAKGSDYYEEDSLDLYKYLVEQKSVSSAQLSENNFADDERYNYVLSQLEGTSSKYKPITSIFTKLQNIPSNEFGKGGKGTGFTDARIEWYGDLVYKINDESVPGVSDLSVDRKYGPTHGSEFSGDDLHKGSDTLINGAIDIKRPTKGESGAIIISW